MVDIRATISSNSINIYLNSLVTIYQGCKHRNLFKTPFLNPYNELVFYSEKRGVESFSSTKVPEGFSFITKYHRSQSNKHTFPLQLVYKSVERRPLILSSHDGSLCLSFLI